MKTLKSIDATISKANEHIEKAANFIKKAKEHQKRLRSLLSVLALILSLNLSAQNFKEINFLGMSVDQVDTCKLSLPFKRITDKPENGHELRGFYSQSTGAVKLIFNANHICNCIMVYSNPTRKLIIDRELYVVNTIVDKTDNNKIIHVISVKSLFSK
jgi:hypothetical protein